MSTAVAIKARMTPEDLLAMPDEKSYELVGGQLVERKTGLESSWASGRLLVRLGLFCEEHGLGWVFNADNGYECFIRAGSSAGLVDPNPAPQLGLIGFCLEPELLFVELL
jgi:hypothetical protein